MWYPRYFRKLREIENVFINLNSEIPSFSKRFPFINYISFKEQCKYWLHWIRKMDPRERHIYKEWNPIILLNDEEWLHLDLSKPKVPIIDISKPKVPIIDISFYWPDSEWISTTIFDSLYELQNYLSHNKDSAKQFTSMVKRIVTSKTWGRTKEKNKMINNKDDSFFIDEEGEIGLSPEYLDKCQKKYREYRKIHPKR